MLKQENSLYNNIKEDLSFLCTKGTTLTFLGDGP